MSMRSALVVLAKELRVEWRTRAAANALLMFVLSSVFLIVYATRGTTLDDVATSALMWTVVVFSAAIGMSRSFIVEEEQQTTTLLRLHATPNAVYLGKLLFNFVLLLLVNLLALVFFVFLLNVEAGSPLLLATTTLVGALALAGATTLLSAIVSKTRGGSALLPVLLFPLLLPLLGAAVRATTIALEGGPVWSMARDHLIALVAFAGVTITASLLLFEQVWND